MRKERRREEEEREEEEREKGEKEEREKGEERQQAIWTRWLSRGATTFRRRRSRQQCASGPSTCSAWWKPTGLVGLANSQRGDLLGLAQADRPARRGVHRRGLVGFREAEAVIFL